MKTTTQRIYADDMEWVQKCMMKLNIKSFAKFIRRLKKEVKLQLQREFYSSLPQVVNGKIKPLKNKKIKKMYTK